jgi:5'-phosphate synthase pdxT subunit
MKVGVLAMQGAFREHVLALQQCGCEVIEVRQLKHLEEIDALVIPGGESTTIVKLLIEYQITTPLTQLINNGLPVFGTCAGAILLARDIIDSDQPRLGVLDLSIKRNAYGRQVDSFEVDLDIPVLGSEPMRAVFIRAPYIESVGPGVEVLASYQGKIILARQGKILVATFHPELTPDMRLHQYFLDMVAGRR